MLLKVNNSFFEDRSLFPALIAALFLGVLQGLSVTLASAVLQIAALSAFLWLLLKAKSAKRGFLLGLFFGSGWFASALYWVYISVKVYGELPAPLSVAAVLILSLYLALYPALASAVLAFLKCRTTRNAPVLLVVFPALWSLAEWCRGEFFTGFPWAATQYAHIDGMLAAFAPVVGGTGIGYLSALLSALLLYACLSVRERRGLGGACALLAGSLVLGVSFLLPDYAGAPSTETLKVRLVQGGITQDDKFSAFGTRKSFERYLSLGEAPGIDRAQLVVLPETIFPAPVSRVPRNMLEALYKLSGADRTLIFGGFLREKEGFANAAIVVREGRISERYLKKHLVPFGEFVPFGFRWFVDFLKIPMGDLTRGNPDQSLIKVSGVSIAPLLCYEDLFPEEIKDWWAGASSPQLLVNLSNLAWFGDSAALSQHLAISRMRAMEFARPVIRATNTGATAVIDARGKVLQEAEFMSPGFLDAQVSISKGVLTPFVRTPGWVPPVVFLLLLALGIFLSKRDKRA